jgi:hypothetical protein
LQTHGHGDVDDETHELAVAVGEAKHGVGLGARLMSALAEAASRGRASPVSA